MNTTLIMIGAAIIAVSPLLTSCTTTAGTESSSSVIADSRSWNDTGLNGIKYRWGSNQILYILNTTGDWQRIRYNDGTRWRDVLLKTGENSEPVASNTGYLKFEYQQ